MGVYINREDMSPGEIIPWLIGQTQRDPNNWVSVILWDFLTHNGRMLGVCVETDDTHTVFATDEKYTDLVLEQLLSTLPPDDFIIGCEDGPLGSTYTAFTQEKDCIHQALSRNEPGVQLAEFTVRRRQEMN